MKDKEQLNNSQKNQCRWLDTWGRSFNLLQSRKKSHPHANASQLSCSRPAIGSRRCEKKVMKDKEQLNHSQKNQSRWLDTWGQFFNLLQVRKKDTTTRPYFSAKLFQAYIRLQTMWKESKKGQRTLESLAKKSVQMARHVKAIFQVTTSSQKNHSQMPILLS